MGGNHSIETAICAQLDEAGLNAFIQAALDVADDRDSSAQSFAARLVASGAPPASTGADPLDVTTWAAAGVDLEEARNAIGQAAKGKDKAWFRRVDKGRRLGRFILETPDLQAGDVKATLDELRAAIYARPGAAPTPSPVHQPEPSSQAERSEEPDA